MADMKTKLTLQKEEIILIQNEIRNTEASTDLSPNKQSRMLTGLETKLLKQQKKLLQLEEEAESKKKQIDSRDDHSKCARDFIEENNLYYFEHGNGMWIRSDGLSSSDNLKITNRENWWPNLFGRDADPKKDFFGEVQRQLADMGRTYNNVTQSFDNTISTSLNLMRNAKSAFVQPFKSEDPVHPLITALFNSLGAHKAENVEHIQDVIFHKWVKPENYNLPALIISGEGGTGKNVLADSFLATLFGGAHTTVSISDLGANFNDELEAKSAVLVDEGSQKFGKAKSNAIKAVIGNPNININIKFGLRYTAANTALYIITSNDRAGVWLGNDSSDRRYSIMYVEKNKQNTLFDVIALDILKLQYSGEIGHKDNRIVFRQAQDYWDQNKFALEDPEEIGKWLFHYQKVVKPNAPSALHGDDYFELSEKQSTDIQRFFSNIFLSPNFKVITKSEIWKWWQGHMRGQNTGKQSHFYNDLEEFIADHSGITMKIHNTIPTREGCRSNVNIIYSSAKYSKNNIPDICFDEYRTSSTDFVCPEDFAIEQSNVTPISPHLTSPAEVILNRARAQGAQ
jgi:hypothetical protein